MSVASLFVLLLRPVVEVLYSKHVCSDAVQQHAMSIGQDIEGHVLFPEDNYGASEEEGPQPEDKV